jgi:flagellar biosynthetic protein FliO
VDSISFFWSFFKMLVALAVVIGLMITSAYYIKKYFLQSMPEMNGSAMINIVSTRYLSPKNSLLLIEVLGQVMLVGVTGQQMSMLSRIDDPEALEKIKNARIRDNQFSDVNPLARYKSLTRILDSIKKGH